MIKYNDEIYQFIKSLPLEERIVSLSYLCQMLVPNHEFSKIIIDLLGFIRNENNLYSIKNTVDKQILIVNLDKLEEKIYNNLANND